MRSFVRAGGSGWQSFDSSWWVFSTKCSSSKIFDLWSSCCLLLPSSCHLGSSPQKNIEIPSHPSENDCHENKKQQMLVTMWRRGEVTFIYCWWECKSSTMEISIELSKRLKIETIIWSSYISLGYIPIKINKDACTPIFKMPLLTIAKLWYQHRCSSTDE
jgi:hypothetical protein